MKESRWRVRQFVKVFKEKLRFMLSKYGEIIDNWIINVIVRFVNMCHLNCIRIIKILPNYVKLSYKY